jgi:hypothetical protein
MLVCICGKKYVSQAKLDAHLEKGVHEVLQEEIKEPVDAPEKPVEGIVLKFKRPIEVGINGVHYDGTEVIAPSLAIAAEIIRIAREAFGSDIL